MGIKELILLVLLLVTILLTCPIALAYIDPGTGATMIGQLWPLLVAGLTTASAFLLKHFWSPIKRFFSRIFSKK